MTGPARVLVVGPHGVTGSAITQRLEQDNGWSIVTVSRRAAGEGVPPRHVSVDLLDRQAAAKALSPLGDVTHVVYAAYTERPTMAAATAPNVAMLCNVLDGLPTAGARLEHVVLIGGGKSYGEHLGPYRTPAKESDPRLLVPIFYNDQEDLLAARGTDDSIGWTVLRPDIVIGHSIGSPMNLLTSIAVFAALSRDAGVPLRFPGSPGAWTALHQFTDAELLASATAWALVSDSARGQVFNVVNGDHIRWQHLWPDIADWAGVPTATPQPMSLVEQMADKGPDWQRLIDTHGLRQVPFDAAASWAFADGVWNSGYDLVQSTIKIRKAGFHDCIDSHESLLAHLAALREARHVP